MFYCIYCHEGVGSVPDMTPVIWLPGLCLSGHTAAILAKSPKLLGLSVASEKWLSGFLPRLIPCSYLPTFRLEHSLIRMITQLACSSLPSVLWSRIWAVHIHRKQTSDYQREKGESSIPWGPATCFAWRNPPFIPSQVSTGNCNCIRLKAVQMLLYSCCYWLIILIMTLGFLWKKWC